MLIEPDRRGLADAVEAGWEGAPSPALLVSADGAVVAANTAARGLLPSAGPGTPLADCAPAWLSTAHRSLTRRGAKGARGTIGDRTYAAHPVAGDGGPVTWWLTDDTDATALRTDLHHERERTAFLRTASDELLSSLNVARTMEVAAELAAGRLADAVWVVGPQTRGRHGAVVCVDGGRARTTTLAVSVDDVPGLAEALQGFPPVPSRWIDPSAVPAWLVPDGFGDLGSVVVTALPGHGVPAGAMVLLRRSDRHGFDEVEEGVARLFAARVGAALAAGRLFEEQSAITDVLTAQLLPPTLQQVDGVEYAGLYRPAQDTSRLGGDFYDVHALPDGGALALLGDVCGKGLEAAVLTGKIRNTMQALLPMAGDHGRMLELLNSALLSSRETRFATLVVASTAWEGEQLRLRLTRAGHLPPLVIRADGRVEEFFTPGAVVGVLPTISAVTETIDLAPGETCLLYTDGIVEARGGPLRDEMFGEDRLLRALGSCAGMPAEALVEHVLMLATDWLAGASHDDMAVLAITAPARPGRRPAAAGRERR